MENILQKIRSELSLMLKEKKQIQALDKIYEQAQNSAKKSRFKTVLRPDDCGAAVIAELKKASPSMGLIRADFDVEVLASALQKGGASALSVLTEPNHFLGDLQNLRLARKAVDLPLLRKDFIFDKYQICEAVIYGAEAVLLIAKMLDAKEFKELFDFAKSLGLDVLSEAHDAREIAVLADCGADIIGVNCRNLENFATDFSICENLLSTIPDGIVRVAESAISSREDYLRACDAGAHAVLVGTQLMRDARNPELELKKLRGLA